MQMFSAAVRLLLRSAGQLWKLDRTTIPTIVIPTIALALAIFLSVSKRGNQRIGAVAVTEVKKWLNGVAWITAIAASLYWIVVFGWTVAKTVYTENRDLDHRAEIATIQWKDRVNRVHIDEPAYRNLMGAFKAFSDMRQIPSQRERCLILITGSGRSFLSETLTLAASMTRCNSGGFNGTGDSDTPEARAALMKDYSVDHVVVHAPREDRAAYVLADKLSELTFVQKSWSLLPWTPKGVVWIQVGADVDWYRQN